MVQRVYAFKLISNRWWWQV